MPVIVSARLVPFSDKTSMHSFKHGISLKEILSELSIPLARVSVNVTVDGVLIEDLEAVPWNNSLINIIVVPRGNKTAMKKLGLMGLGAGSLALLYFLNKKSSTASTQQNYQGTAAQNNAAVPLPEPYEPPPTPVTFYGGPASVQVNSITGIQNKTNNYGPFPRVYGKRKVFPVTIGNPFTFIQGAEQWLYWVGTCGYGELDITSVQIGEKPITNFLPADLQYEIKYGTLVDTPVAIYTNDVQEEVIDLPLSYNVSKQKFVPQKADNISIDFHFPNGLYGRQQPSGTVIASNASFDIDYRIIGTVPWTHIGASPTVTFVDSTPALVRKNFNFDVLRDNYEVRITRTTIDPPVTNPDTGQSLSTFHAIKGILYRPPVKVIRDANGTVIPMTFIALKVRATTETNGVVQEVSCVAQSKLNYFDGAVWQPPVISRNPAWVFADIVTGTAFGRQLDYLKLDAMALLDWANFCATQGFFFDHVYDTQTTMAEALKDVAAAGRATLSVVDGKITVVVDKPRPTLVQHFSQANIGNLKVHRIWPIVPHAIRVKFINPLALWQTDERIVYADGFNEANATRYETIEPLGLTDANAAYKIGRYYIATAQLRPKTYEFDVDVQHLVCNRGDLVRLTHDVALHGIGASLIKSLTTNIGGDITHIILEQAMPMVAMQLYQARVRLSDGSSSLQDIVAFNGETNVLELSTPILFATNPKPVVGNLLLFGEKNKESVELIITAIDHNFETLLAHLTAVPYSPAVFTADVGVIPPFDSQVKAAVLVNSIVEMPVLLP